LLTASLAQSDLPKGLFTKELEAALLSGEADLAVHSLKDLPTEIPAGLQLGAVSRRVDVRDVLVYRDARACAARADSADTLQRRGFPAQLAIADLPMGATVATSSTRRSAQLLERRRDLKVVPIRGNVGTRLRKLAELAELDATVLAAAGLERLGMRIRPDGQLVGEGVPGGLRASLIDPHDVLPCVGQAALGIEIREGDVRLERICAVLNDPETRLCVAAERAFLAAMGGGCHLAVAAYARVEDGQIVLQAVSFLAGAARRGEAWGALDQPELLGRQMAARLQGAP